MESLKNSKYQVSVNASPYTLLTSYNAFIEELSKTKQVNLVINESFRLSDSGIIPTAWEVSGSASTSHTNDHTSITLPISGSLYQNVYSNDIVSSQILPNKNYTIMLYSRSSSNFDLELISTTPNILFNINDLNQTTTLSSSISTTPSSAIYWEKTLLQFSTASSGISGPINLSIKNTGAASGTIQLQYIALYEGLIEYSEIPPKYKVNLVLERGTEVLPSLSYANDTDTGIFSPDANILAFTTSGTERARIIENGTFLYGTKSSLSNGKILQVNGDSYFNGSVVFTLGVSAGYGILTSLYSQVISAGNIYNFGDSNNIGYVSGTDGKFSNSVSGISGYFAETLYSSSLSSNNFVSNTILTNSLSSDEIYGNVNGNITGEYATFSNSISAKSGIFSGPVIGTSGYFSSAISGSQAYFNGPLSATFGYFTNNVRSAGSGFFSGAVTGASGYFAGPVNGTSGNFTGPVNGAGGYFTGPVTGAAGNFTGPVNGTSGNFTGNIYGQSGFYSGDLKVIGSISATGDVSGRSGNFTAPVTAPLFYGNLIGNVSGSANQANYLRSVGPSNGNFRISANSFGGLSTLDLNASNNIALGHLALNQGGLTGANNIAIGGSSLINNTLGANNIALGFASMLSMVSGVSNVIIGNLSGYNLTGNNNVFIGNGAGYYQTNTSNTIILDVLSRGSLSNEILNSPVVIQANSDLNEQNIRLNGNLFIGGSATQNYISFRGTAGDDSPINTHTFIGERLVTGEDSELVIFKGNDSNDSVRLISGNLYFETTFPGANGPFSAISTLLTKRAISIWNNGNVRVGDVKSDSGYKLTVDGNLYVGTVTKTQSLEITSQALVSNLNAEMLGGLRITIGRNDVGDRVVRTDSSGHLQCGLINSTTGDQNIQTSPNRVWGTNGVDSYLRTYSTSTLSCGYAANSGKLGGRSSSDFYLKTDIVSNALYASNSNTLDGHHYSEIINYINLSKTFIWQGVVAHGYTVGKYGSDIYVPIPSGMTAKCIITPIQDGADPYPTGYVGGDHNALLTHYAQNYTVQPYGTNEWIVNAQSITYYGWANGGYLNKKITSESAVITIIAN